MYTHWQQNTTEHIHKHIHKHTDKRAQHNTCCTQTPYGNNKEGSTQKKPKSSILRRNMIKAQHDVSKGSYKRALCARQVLHNLWATYLNESLYRNTHFAHLLQLKMCIIKVEEEFLFYAFSNFLGDLQYSAVHKEHCKGLLCEPQ